MKKVLLFLGIALFLLSSVTISAASGHHYGFQAPGYHHHRHYSGYGYSNHHHSYHRYGHRADSFFYGLGAGIAMGAIVSHYNYPPTYSYYPTCGYWTQRCDRYNGRIRCSETWVEIRCR